MWPLRWLASLTAGFFAWAVGVRNVMFDLEVKKVRRLDVPVISVGNIVVGGTG
ncbi:MAG: tetraacyldisaccharide 4'-kinase, partial [Proteobacteria bacterium]|nr:tetraacyldisaccharide 4'-kinase [Pseudomonadota bacterium]